jgi:biotin carboxyl carrier protein
MELLFEGADGVIQAVEVNRQADGSLLVERNGQSYHMTYQWGEGGELWLWVEGMRQQVVVARRHQRTYVAIQGQVIELEKTTRAKQRHLQQPGMDDLTAPMPGQVTQLLVTLGESVQAGQTLLILEAMKMELRVKALHDGQVLQVFCQVGQAVERGQVLIEIG